VPPQPAAPPPETPAAPAGPSLAPASPWAFNLTLYMWLPGVKGNFEAGPLNASADASFIDIAGKLRNLPLAFMGRLEGHYDRFGLYLDGNYMDLDFKPRIQGGISKGLTSQMSIVEYGALYRLFGAPAAERIGHWEEKGRSNGLDLYLGGRTIMLNNTIQTHGYGDYGTSATLTSPILGARVGIDLTPSWYLLVDANGGGFGVDKVEFTGAAMGMVGYKTRLFSQPVSLEIGYKALRIQVTKPVIETKATFNGAFVGFTTYW
jgi:hypothetical protein